MGSLVMPVDRGPVSRGNGVHAEELHGDTWVPVLLLVRLRFILHDRMENKHQQLLLTREANTEIENQSSELLKDLASKWFMDTQAPLLLQNGTLPEWFHGFITRKQTEDRLTDKDLGCFLIRLSDKAIGYILSYRGKDRCRHFVINYLRNGHYVVSGDTCTHESLADLIEYYQTSEIEPFGENLTTACTQRLEKSVYDEISWDQQTSSKQSKSSSGTVNPLLIKQVSGSLPTTVPKKDTPSSPAQDEKHPSLPLRSKKTLQEQQRNLSGEKKHFSHEVSTLNIRSFRTENHTDNSCEETPEHCLKGSSAKQVPGTNHTYELISMDQVKGAEAKSNLKIQEDKTCFLVEEIW
ncbi:SH2 domain-containing protein 7 isoform C [Alligator mississippiensis]|uniref:SH2 domain-containing protein 7 isoform C n=1 Tax=Alligator mississippiensis TaxID=8496 RepID=A0A151M9Y5_ALLMI|nr:SH2 domain-containing protein 7 isoform C [Alligator mississippiensis]